MKQRKDYIGQRFGRLVVIEALGWNAHHHRLWLVRCDCGMTKQVLANSLVSHRVKSCGCLQRERNYIHGDAAGCRQTPEYHSWANVIQRCHNPANKDWALYGGRGVYVCQRWRESFEAFLLDMGRRPGPGYSIDRINNNGPYSKANCKWSTAKEQASNRRPRRQRNPEAIQIVFQDFAIPLALKTYE